MRGLLWSTLVSLPLLAACGSASAPTGPTDGSTSGSSTSAPATTHWSALPRPNVLLVIADDLGYGDLSSYGSTTIATPALDRLASEGIRFTAAYVSTPLCAPSRAAIYTGRHGGRNGIPWNPPDGLDADEVSIAQVLRGAGYATALVGKWHLGWGAEDLPTRWGFEYYEGILNGGDTKEWMEGEAYKYAGIGTEGVTPRYTDLALEWLRTVPRGQPWLLTVAHRDPHTPLIPAPGFYKSSQGGLFGDVVQGLDHHVGRLLDGVRELGYERDTIVIFLSDNGPAREQPEWPTTGSTGPFRGQKGFCLEGGVRVPMIVRWPAAIEAGRVVDDPVYSLDLFPTLVQLARAGMPERKTYDGRSLADLLSGSAPRPAGGLLYFQTGGHLGGYREGGYKLLLDGAWGRGGLFDLAADPREANDLAPQLQDVASRLEAHMVDAAR